MSVNKIRNEQFSMDSFHTNGSSSENRISNNSSEQDHRHCSRSGDSCPNQFICNDTTAGMCQCGPGYIRCDENKMVSTVLNCFCVTSSNNELHAGYCFYNCKRPIHIKNVYHEISNKVDLNEHMCGRFNRTGISCGQCKNGTSESDCSLVLYELCGMSRGTQEPVEVCSSWICSSHCCFLFIVFSNINVTSSRLHGLCSLAKCCRCLTLFA